MQFEITGALLQNSAGEQKPQLNLNDSWEQVSGVTYEEPQRGQSILKLLTKFGSERSELGCEQGVTLSSLENN